MLLKWPHDQSYRFFGANYNHTLERGRTNKIHLFGIRSQNEIKRNAHLQRHQWHIFYLNALLYALTKVIHVCILYLNVVSNISRYGCFCSALRELLYDFTINDNCVLFAILPVSLKLDFIFVLFCLVCWCVLFSVYTLVEQTTAHCGATFVNLALLKISAQLQPQITSNGTLLKERRRQNANAKKEQMCAIITLRHRIRGKKTTK